MELENIERKEVIEKHGLAKEGEKKIIELFCKMHITMNTRSTLY